MILYGQWGHNNGCAINGIIPYKEKGLVKMDKKSMFSDLYRKLEELDGSHIIVGVQGEEGTNFHGQKVASDEEMQKIAWVHEYGIDIEVTPKMRAFLHRNGLHLKADTKKIHIPERSYIRKAQAEGKADFKKLYEKQIGRLLNEEITVDEVLEEMAKQALTETVAGLGDGSRPVSSYTMEHRKSSHNPTPLVDTGKLQNHITYRIEKGGGSG